MAKKRKASARSDAPQGAVEFDPRESRKRIKTFEDVADSDDDFHLHQDEIRLDEAPEVKRRRKWAEQEEFLQESEEEILGDSDSEADSIADPRLSKASANDADGFDDDEGDEPEDGDGNDGWGMSKADLYGADAIETEEQAIEEEAEARRLQKKQLASMNAADYGFDENDWMQETEADNTAEPPTGSHEPVTEVLPQLQIAPDLSQPERIKLLKSRYPEFEPLSKELLELSAEHQRLQLEPHESALERAKFRAASAYLATLVMYFTLLTSTASRTESGSAALPASQIREHPVIEQLTECRDIWRSFTGLPMPDHASSAVADKNALLKEDPVDERRSTEAEISLASAPEPATINESRAQRYVEAVQAAANQRQAGRVKKTEADLASLEALTKPSALKRPNGAAKPKARAQTGDEDDFGEGAPLTAREAEDKAKRKKSLRFYTSQIAQKANKRGAAGRNAGGDDDIPHRERLRDRQARLNAEAEKRGQRDTRAGADLGQDSDEEDRRMSQQIRQEVDDDDYYDLIAARTARKKGEKAALAEVQRQAAISGGQVVTEETVGADGKRKISYAIEKNKGLTPHRKKDVRNPRVKKRKKYDEKKKKLASIKPVYKGGEGRGGYGGELTGIKKGLVKSTKL